MLTKQKDREPFLRSTTGETIALQSVHVEGRLDGLLLSTAIRQNYRNTANKALEIVYSFPVGWDSTLLGMDVEIGGKRLQGTVIEKKEAEEKYEKAVDEGDTPVMVQESSPGVYTANLGNIKAGESVSVEIRCAQLLRFEQDQIRVKIPTVIAPRYGDAHKHGGMAPHESDAVDMAAHYPFTLRLDISGESAQAKVSSPSHNVNVTPTENGVSVLLESGALDRDVILILQGLAGHSFALAVPDEDQWTMLASFCPKLPVKADPLALKILVDCSGSMNGDSIFQAQKALRTILSELSTQDFLAFSRFGSDVDHAARVMEPCTPDVLEKFAALVRRTAADMGGTEMEDAVLSTCKDVSLPENVALRPCILLITDDLYWNKGSMLRQAMESGHRFFTIGVGSAPAECLLRQLAEKTGGACEFVTPNEDMAATIVRMFRRMRTAQTNKLSVVWGSEPLWQSALPLSCFDGETLHLFATFAEAPSRMPFLFWETAGKSECASPGTISVTENRDITRLGAARRMAAAPKQEALNLALKYQLVSDQSSLFLVYLREGEDKVTELPELHQVPQMMAAGSHGYGSVVGSIAGSTVAHSFAGVISGHRFLNYFSESLRSKNIYKSNKIINMNKIAASIITPQELLERFDKHALASQDYALVLQRMQDNAWPDLESMVDDFARQEGITLEQAWAVLLDWLTARLAQDCQISRHAKRLLRSQIKAFDQVRHESLHTSLNSKFASVSASAW